MRTIYGISHDYQGLLRDPEEDYDDEYDEREDWTDEDRIEYDRYLKEQEVKP